MNRIPLAILYSILPRHFTIAGQSNLSPTELSHITSLIKLYGVDIKNNVKTNNTITITWPKQLGHHTDTIPLSLIRIAQGLSRKEFSKRIEQSKPKPLLPLSPRIFSYSTSLNIYDILSTINKDGMVILKKDSNYISEGIINEEDTHTVLHLANVLSNGIGALKTIYGTSFVVTPVSNAINVAYTTSKLSLHQDLPYYESPPGLQILHCLRNDTSVIGGESTFLDGFHLADRFLKRYPSYFRILSNTSTCFQKLHYEREIPVHMLYHRPIIQVTHPLGQRKPPTIVALYWSPPFENPSLALCERSRRSEFMDARNAFADFIDEAKDTTDLLEMRYQPGDIVIFNNRRMLHGRNEFVIKGKAMRTLAGCYVNVDDWKSTLSVESSKQNKLQENFKRVGNGDAF